VTLTLKLHDREAVAASVAVHCTCVVPTGNREPELRLHDTWIGATPPDVDGAAKFTAMPPPLVAVAVWLIGQPIVNAGFGVGFGPAAGGVGVWVDVGAVGEEHAAAANTIRAAAPLTVLTNRNRRNSGPGNNKLYSRS
jgi:hypothetical protein